MTLESASPDEVILDPSVWRRRILCQLKETPLPQSFSESGVFRVGRRFNNDISIDCCSRFSKRGDRPILLNDQAAREHDFCHKRS